MGTPTAEPTPRAARAWTAHPLWVLAPLAAVAYALSFSWGRWGDPVIDWGRELEVARRIAAGDRLYADVHYWYGPLAPHVNAALFGAFGVHTRVLQAAGLVSVALMSALLWALGGRLAGTLAAAAVTAAFLSLCAFGHYYVSDIFNWVTPYAYPATYGMIFATASLYALLRALEPPGHAWFAVSLACLGLALATKVEPAVAALGAHAAYAWVTVRRGQHGLAGLALTYGAILGAAAITSPGVVSTLVALANSRTAVPIVRYMGWTEWATAVPAVAWSALRLLACITAPIAAARLAAMTGWQSLGLALAVSVPIGAFADQSPETALRGLPVVALVALVDAVRRAWDDAADVVLWAFVAGALLRLPLSAGAYHYGFYLLPIPLAALLLLWFRRLPPLIADSPRGATFCAATAATLVATLGATHLPASAAFYRQHTAHVRTARGDLWLLDGVGGIPIGRFYAEAVARLATFPPETTVFAAPEGAGLAFLAGRPSWGADLSYYPPALGPDADARLRAALATAPPGVVLLLNVIDVRHYGATGFGRDYGMASVAWLQEHFQSDLILPGNTIVIARPRATASPSP